MKMRHLVVVAAVIMGAAGVSAQEPPAAQGGAVVQRRAPQVIPLEVRVVISKFQGEKRLSSLPYTLAVNANSFSNTGALERAQLTIGSDVPVPMSTFTPGGDKDKVEPLRSYTYRNVGTVISASAASADDGRFELDLSIDESSVGTSSPAGSGSTANDMPVFKSAKTRNKILLRGGQAREFLVATDRVSGETVKIEVTLTVVK